MNAKRRAELQRKLRHSAVPRPPAGLMERIKADIPKYLDAEAERGRFSRAVAFNMRVAASILLLVTSLVVTVYLMTPEEQPSTLAAHMRAPAVEPEVPRTSNDAISSSTPPPAQQARLSDEEEAAPVTQIAEARPLVARERQEAKKEDDEAPVVGGVAGGVIGEPAYVEGVPAPKPESVVVTAEAPRMAANTAAPQRAVAAPAPAAIPAPAPAERLDASGSFLSEAHAAKIHLAQSSVFGISVDAQVFQRIKTTLENGGRPDASAVDVDALVNYFAGPPAKRPRRIVLDVEASPAPIEAEGDHAVLRLTVDTPGANVPEGGSMTPVATDARIEVDVNENVVANAHRIGNEPTTESVLLSGTSVTGLYALELKPNLRSNQVVATVRLHYTSMPDGRKRTITKEVHGHDLAKSWQRSSRRHRLASLGAVWGETLKGTAGGTAVARRAEELATEEPKDSRAKELAKAASASAGSK